MFLKKQLQKKSRLSLTSTSSNCFLVITPSLYNWFNSLNLAAVPTSCDLTEVFLFVFVEATFPSSSPTDQKIYNFYQQKNNQGHYCL